MAYGLWPYQKWAVEQIDAYRWVNEIGGRGSGKSFKDPPRVVRWAEMCTDLAIGIFAATDEALQTGLGPITELIESMGLEHVYASRAPKSWRQRWVRDGIQVPPPRHRTDKFWIWENGTHIFTSSIVNNAYTRAKGIDMNAALFLEGTESGVTLNAIMTVFGCLRCGRATKGNDGVWRCLEPGHIHQLVIEGNTPLNNPGHFMYRKHDQLMAQEATRKAENKKPFYLPIFWKTSMNPATGEGYIDGLRAAFDATTFEEQTKGGLERNTALLSYYAFSEKNILTNLTYDPTRPLHMYFDWNAHPAAVGWGHDLRYDEVPEPDRRSDGHYFGAHGELFSGWDVFVTAQVVEALLLDPTEQNASCVDCNDAMSVHMEMVNGFLCKHCAWTDKRGRHCSGKVRAYEQSQKTYIKAPPNWRGLMAHRGKIFVYGDATGSATSSQSSGPGGNIKIVRDAFNANLGDRVFFRFKKANPPVNLRVLAMNRAFCDGRHVHSFFVADWLTAHKDDFRGVVPDPKNNGDPLKKSKSSTAQKSGDDYELRTDISDAAGYMVDYRWPFSIPKADAGGGYVGDGTDFGPLADLGSRP